MQHINDIAQEILKAEGGFVNDPDDPGGPTNYGVKLKTRKRLGHDLNQDGRVDIADLKQLSSTQAVQIFVQDYFYKPQIDQLPHMLHAPVFNMYVNAGSHAVKVLQRTLIQFDMDITVDGVIGPITIAATQTAARRAPDHLVDAYGIERVNYYLSLGDARPNLRYLHAPAAGIKANGSNGRKNICAPAFTEAPLYFNKGQQHCLNRKTDGFCVRGGVQSTVEVFCENSEKSAVRAHVLQQAAFIQFATEFRNPRSGFDRFIDGVNRLPRPAMAFGVLGLFIAAMVDPIWYADRMAGLSLVPEPLWWLLGAIVSFYFGARHQSKSFEIRAQDMQKHAETIAQTLQTNAIKPIGPIQENAAVAEWHNGT